VPKIAIFSLAVAAIWACGHAPREKPAMIAQDQAIEIAKAELTRHGRSPSDYDVSVEPDAPSRTSWMVCFERKGPFRVPGGRHCVRVEKSTGTATFLEGE